MLRGIEPSPLPLGCGEMGERIREFDWQLHPFGPPQEWNAALLAALGICLNSSVPTAIYWGPELRLLYNDAWSSIPAERHPWALGRPAHEVWKDIWPVVGPQFESVVANAVGLSVFDQVLLLERQGKTVETYWNYSFTPILDAEGAVLGVFNQGNETTLIVAAARERAAETEKLRETFAQAPGAIAVLRGPDHRFEIANSAYIELIGGRDDIVGLTLSEALPEVVDQGFVHLLDRVFQTGEPYVGEGVIVELLRNDVREKRVLDFVYQPMRNAAGAVDGIFVQAADRTERTKAEKARVDGLQRRAFLDDLHSQAQSLTHADAILEKTTEMLAKHLNASICAYADMDADEDGFTIRGDWAAEGSKTVVGRYRLQDFGELAVGMLRAGNPLIITDNRSEIAPHEAATFQAIGITATVCMPLLKSGRLTALMAAHHNHPHAWTPEEVALIRDVTERSWAHVERVKAEQAFRESEDRLRLATEAALIGTWDFDPATRELKWDARCKALFGLGPDAQVSYEDSFLAGLHPDDLVRTDAAVRAAIALGGSPDYDIEYRTIGIEDGVERWIAARGTALFDGNRAVRFIGTVLDITGRKRAERRFELVNEIGAAVAAERNIDKIVQQITDAGVELTGAEFGAFFYNKLDENGESLMLYSLSGVPREHFDRFPMPRNTAVFAPTFSGESVVRSDDIRADPRYGKNPPHRGMPEGHLPVVSYLAVPVISSSGEVIGGLFFGHKEKGVFRQEHEVLLSGLAGQAATAIDNSRLIAELQRVNATLEQRVSAEVAERTRTEEQLRQSQKMEAIGQLTGGIAHDFNNMLAVVLGGLNLAQRRLDRGETDVKKYIDGAIDGAKRAASLTQRLLAFSRQQPLEPISLDANKLVNAMTELLARTLGDHIQVETVLTPGLWRCFIDQVQLESAVLNLAVNARDAMPNGGKLSIETANAAVDGKIAREYALPEGQYVQIAVTDSGTGMNEDVIARAFDPFFTTKAVGKGSGLGLSQVFGFVRQSGGHVKLYSEIDVGTTVKLYLPRHSGRDDPDNAGTVLTEQSYRNPNEIVLVVEDEERVRNYSVEALKELGYVVIAADGPRDALRIIENGQRVDLLFTDVVMPEINGRQLADRALALLPTLKVLYTTGYTRNAVVHNGVLDAGTAFLSKPFTIDQLAAKIRQVLDR
jgi:PAS domain S-box-containing protein